jgi:hypothetical protein
MKHLENVALQRFTDLPPVLVIAFNRPDLLRENLGRLRRVGVEKLFISIDGPRESREKELALVRECQLLAQGVDWVKDLNVQFHRENLGCKRGVASAIDWFFSHVSYGIILEDDVIVDNSFFNLASWALEEFGQNSKVGVISASNFVPDSHTPKELSIRFNSIPHITGWATWKRVWSDFHLPECGRWKTRLPIWKILKGCGWSASAVCYWLILFRDVASDRIDTWDYALVRLMFQKQLLTVSPNTNLSQHLGWRSDATHTVGEKPFYIKPMASMNLNFSWENRIEVHKRSDAWTRRAIYGCNPLEIAKMLFVRILKAPKQLN